MKTDWKKLLKENSDFLLRLACLLLVLGMLWGYQTQAKGWAAALAENQAEIAAAEEHNAEVEAEQARLDAEAEGKAAEEAEEAEEADSGLYKDGTYTGVGAGFGGDITVQVTVSGGEITAIDILDAPGEDASYLAIGKDIIPNIIAAQSADVDTISGATFSSGGIKSAVEQALSEAVNSDAN